MWAELTLDIGCDMRFETTAFYRWECEIIPYTLIDKYVVNNGQQNSVRSQRPIYD